MKNLHVACFVAAIVLIRHGNAQSFATSFETPGSFQTDFNVYENTGGGTVTFVNAPYSQSATSGVGGSGGIDILLTGVADSTAIYKNISFNFASSGNALTISAFMKVIAPTETGNREMQLGFVNNATSGFASNAGLAFTSLRFNPTAVGSVTFIPQWQTKTAAGALVNTTVSPNITFVQNDWYLMSLTFANNGGGNIIGTGFVADFGPSGTTAGTVTSITGANLTSADIAADATVFAAFRGFNRDGASTLDDFSATTTVPEPSTYALLTAGAGAIFMASRRRRS